MKNERLNPSFILNEINLENMTLRELGDVAAAHGWTLLDILTL